MTTFMQDLAVANHEVIGKLIKQWSTGKDYLKMRDDQGNSLPFPVPASGGPAALAEIQRQFDLVGANLKLTERFKATLVVKGDSETFVLKLPAAKFIEQNDANLAAASYPIPDFYAPAVCPAAGAGLGTPAQRVSFDLKRVGDYSISNCC